MMTNLNPALKSSNFFVIPKDSMMETAMTTN